jgi:hypothetical protein
MQLGVTKVEVDPFVVRERAEKNVGDLGTLNRDSIEVGPKPGETFFSGELFGAKCPRFCFWKFSARRHRSVKKPPTERADHESDDCRHRHRRPIEAVIHPRREMAEVLAERPVAQLFQATCAIGDS